MFLRFPTCEMRKFTQNNLNFAKVIKILKGKIKMKEKIEKKLTAHINSILNKTQLSYKDYKTLAAELGRIKADEAAKKWEDEAEERNEKMAQLLCSTFSK